MSDDEFVHLWPKPLWRRAFPFGVGAFVRTPSAGWPGLIVDCNADMDVFAVERVDEWGAVRVEYFAGVELRPSAALAPERLRKPTKNKTG